MKKFLFILLFSTSLLHAETHILFLGDSLSEGLGVNEEEAFPRLVEKTLQAKKRQVIVTNGGVSGATSASGVSRLKWHLKKKTDIVVLELGANDGLRGLKISDTEKNLREIIKFSKENKLKVLLLGLLMPPNYGKKYTDEFSSMYKNIAKIEKIPVMPFMLNNVAGIKKYNQADGIHPNAEGHAIIASAISDFIEKNL